MELFYSLLVLLLVTRIFGEILSRFDQPVLVGELLAGLALGLLLQTFEGSFPILAELPANEVFNSIIDLGIFFLMLLGGIELRPRALYEGSRRAFIVAMGGMLVPMVLALTLGYVTIPDSEWKLPQMLFLGVALSVTAVPVTIATLMDLEMHQSRVGRIIVSAAVFDDLIGLFLLAGLTSVLRSTADFDPTTLLLMGLRVLFFFGAVVATVRYLFPVLGLIAHRLQIKHAEFSVLLILALFFSALAEWLGMHFILGAFAAGLFFTRQVVDESVHEDVFHIVEGITIGFFAPIFFASIGLNLQLEALTAVPGFLIALLAVAFVGKILGGGLSAVACGLPFRSALAVGIGMNARGAVELIIAGVALEAGLFGHPNPAPPIITHLFSAVVIIAILTTVISPIMLRKVLLR